MSEYQYYEFQAIDRPLTAKEQEELRALSSRGEITATSYTNEYNYGSFRGKPAEVLAKYFDVHLYVTNWGTHQLMFRLPRDLVDVAALRAYEARDAVSVVETGPHVLVDLRSSPEEGGGWEQGQGYLAPMLPLRAELLAGDLRCLYLGWLSFVQHGWAKDEDAIVEPPVPPGLAKLTGPLKELAEFLRIEDDLLAVAAKASPEGGPAGPSRAELARWIAARPEKVRNAWLLALAENEEPSPRYEMLRQFRQDWQKKRPKGEASSGPRRTLAELRAAYNAADEERERLAAEASLRKREREAREAVEARARKLDALVGQEEKLWAEVEAAVLTKKAKEYDRATSLLGDLRDLAEKQGSGEAFRARFLQTRERHGTKRTFLERLTRAGLTT